jgi:Ca2+-transporting ATPase
VLALGFRTLPQENPAQGSGDPPQVPRSGFQLIGLLGLRDPLREGAGRAVHDAACAGIRTLIQRRTAQAVAAEVGLRGVALDGAEVTRRLAAGGATDGSEGPDGLDGLAVLSRVTPADKLAVVRALRAQGHVVAMAGDGINDAPALKAADVGISVGRGASDLARQVADVVLAGEDLHSILVAVAEGRIVQDNLRRALRFLFATNFSEMVLVLGAAVVGAREPLTPLQLLWINLLTDTLPALALALTPGDPEVLDRGPAPPGAPLLDRRAWRKVARDGLLLSGLGAAGLAVGGGPMAFSTLTAAQIGYTGVCQAPTAAPDQRYFNLVGGAAGLQLLALLAPWPALRTALGVPAGMGLPLLGFAGGFLVPWLASKLAGGETIVRRSSDRQPELQRRLP